MPNFQEKKRKNQKQVCGTRNNEIKILILGNITPKRFMSGERWDSTHTQSQTTANGLDIRYKAYFHLNYLRHFEHKLSH